MILKKLVKQFSNCSCKKEHLCPIDELIIGKGKISAVKKLTKNYSNVLLVSDNNTCKFAEKVVDLIGEKIENNLILHPQEKVVIPNEEKIEEISNKLTSKTDLIIGVGSGVINDLCKYVAFVNNLPYFIVATAPSMDGYASVGSALILKGMKDTKTAKPPKAIIADTNILSTCPIDMIKAGYGDIIGKFSCLNDWELGVLLYGEYFCQNVYNLIYDCILDVKDLSTKLLKRDKKSIGKLMEGLVIMGIAISFVGNSRPASGSEHHLSHFFEITGIIDKEDYFAHGIDVLYSTYYTQKIREELLKIDKVESLAKISQEDYEKTINKIYTKISNEVINLQEKMGRYKASETQIYIEKWEDIKKLLKKVPSSEEIKKYIENIGLNLEDFEKMYSKEKLQNALYFAKDLKDRFTVLWTYFFLTYKK